MLHKRSALVDPDREPLKGEVEIDELYVGGPEESRPGRAMRRRRRCAPSRLFDGSP